LRLSSSSAVNYLARLGDVIRRRDDDRYELTDRVMALWLSWRAPGGAAVPMTRQRCLSRHDKDQELSGGFRQITDRASSPG